jgi:O-acetyl-ADP-ribose deacetylase (regulator of RNase III)
MQNIKANILNITEGNIGHQVNCRGVMGAGLAKQIRIKYPIVFEEYYRLCKTKTNLLGHLQKVKVNDKLTVLNLFGQEDYSFKSVRNTDYDALTNIAKTLEKEQAENLIGEIYLPYNMGCGLGGGQWEIINTIFNNVQGYWCIR